MSNTKSRLLFGAIAGILSATSVRADEPIPEDRLGKKEVVPCYGINGCKAAGQCSGAHNKCAGGNECRAQGWLPVPKEACLAIPGGSLRPLSKKEIEERTKKS
jgi:hypothetical protein